MRAIVDTLQAESLNKFFMNVKKVNSEIILSGGVPSKFIWVDIGSKFAKMANVLINMTTPKPNDFFIVAKSNADNA